MTGYIVAREAEADVLEIFRYIAADNPDAAKRMRSRLYDSFERLAKRPAMGHARPDLTNKALRFWSAQGRYLVAYRADRTPVEIVRVFGPGRDVAALLR